MTMTVATRSAPRRVFAVALAAIGLTVLALASSRLRGLFANTALLATGTLAISLPVGAMLGIVLAKIDVPGRRLLAWLLVGLLFVPLYVQAAAWQAVLGSGGWLDQLRQGEGYSNPWLVGWQGAIWIHAMAALPWVALLTAASLATVERRLEEESLLDASPPRVLLRVSLRRGGGGLIAAAACVAMTCATEITVTDLFQIRTFAEEIYTDAALGQLAAPDAFLASDLILGVAALAIFAGAALWLVAPWLPAAASVAADASWKWRPQRGRLAIGAAVWLLAAAVVVVPMAGLAWKAGIAVEQRDGEFQRSWAAEKALTMVAQSPWEHRREWGWSLAIGGAAAASAVAVGLLLAWLARLRPRAALPLGAATAIALALPAPLLGVWLIGLMNQPEQSSLAWLTTLYDRSILAPALVQTARALPLVGLWLWSQLATVPRDLLEAARSEGAGPMAQLVRVAVPVRLPGVAAAGSTALAIAVGVLSATLLVAPPGVTTISMRVFELLHKGVDDRVAALALAIFGIMGLVAAGLGMIAAWRRRRVSEPPLG